MTRAKSAATVAAISPASERSWAAEPGSASQTVASSPFSMTSCASQSNRFAGQRMLLQLVLGETTFPKAWTSTQPSTSCTRLAAPRRIACSSSIAAGVPRVSRDGTARRSSAYCSAPLVRAIRGIVTVGQIKDVRDSVIRDWCTTAGAAHGKMRGYLQPEAAAPRWRRSARPAASRSSAGRCNSARRTRGAAVRDPGERRQCRRGR